VLTDKRTAVRICFSVVVVVHLLIYILFYDADSNMRLTRHSSGSTAFEVPVNSSQHGVSAAGQLVIRFWAVTS